MEPALCWLSRAINSVHGNSKKHSWPARFSWGGSMGKQVSVNSIWCITLCEKVHWPSRRGSHGDRVCSYIHDTEPPHLPCIGSLHVLIHFLHSGWLPRLLDSFFISVISVLLSELQAIILLMLEDATLPHGPLFIPGLCHWHGEQHAQPLEKNQMVQGGHRLLVSGDTPDKLREAALAQTGVPGYSRQH